MNQISLKTTKIDEHFSTEDIEILKTTIAPGLSDNEMTLFLYNCVRTGLSPFQRQIYAIKRGGRLCIQTGIDGFRLIAERTGMYAPGKDTEYLYDDNSRLLGAKVYVKKMTADGTWHEVSSMALLKEYSSNQGLWRTLPHVMIAKVAESAVLRRCFPAELSGLYTSDEMDQAQPLNDDSRKLEPTPTKYISDETYQALEAFLSGHEELRDKLKDLCRVTDLRNIDESKLQACRKYATQYLKNLEDTDAKTNP